MIGVLRAYEGAVSGTRDSNQQGCKLVSNVPKSVINKKKRMLVGRECGESSEHLESANGLQVRVQTNVAIV